MHPNDKNHKTSIFNFSKLLMISSIFLLSSCLPKIDVDLKKKSKDIVVSGVVSPLVGLIAESSSSSLFMSAATAAACSTPAVANLYKINTNGTITENSPLVSQILKSDAKFSFNFTSLNLTSSESLVEYVVIVSGCNDDVFKRPITSLEISQDVNARTTVVSEVLNVSTVRKLNEAQKVEVQDLINSLTGTSILNALDSLTNVTANSDKFTDIFGASPAVIKEGKPRVEVNYPSLVINELAVSNFNVSSSHLDPAYDFAYSWKLDGVVKSTAASWNYIPSKNESGTHQIELIVGKNDLSGNVDLTKPHYSQTFNVDVNNNILPAAPAIAISATTPSPITNHSLAVDINTGAAFTNCETFSHMAITDSATPPGVMQFNIDCTTAGTQTESITVSATEGNRNVYLWVIDNEGLISSATSAPFILDTVAPTASMSLGSLTLKGTASVAVTLSAADTSTGVDSLDLYFSPTGADPFTLVSSLAVTASSYTWSVPAENTTTGKLKLVVVDGAGLTTSVLSSDISIDSQAPSAPTLTRTSSAATNNSAVTMTVGSCSGTSDILITTTNTQPLSSASGWQTCSTVAGATLYTLTTNGVNTLYAWAKDAVGNVASSANSISVTYDSINPVIVTGPVIAASVPGGANANITWSVTDASVVTIDLEYHDGTSWASIGDNIFNSGSFAFAVPAGLNVPVAKIRMTVTDSVGNSTQAESINFVIDSTNPQITAFTVANSAPKVNTPTISVQVTGTDNAGGSGLYQMRLSEHAAYANDNWQTYSATNGSYSLSMTPGSKTIYIWVKDKAGNVSNSLSSTVILEFGVPPILSITGPSITPQYAPTEILHITWSCSSATGLAANPISEISYTTDNGASLEIIHNTGLTNNDTATTGHYDWPLPAALASTPFRIYVKCESASGAQVEKMSDVYQTEGTWRIWAGQMSAKRDSVLAYGTNRLMIAPCSTAAMDASGNIYYTAGTGISNTDSITALMKINAITGLVERVTGSYTESATSAGDDWTVGALSSHKIYQRDCTGFLASVVIGTTMDRSEILFLHNLSTPKIYAINSSNQIRLFASLSGGIQTKSFFRQNYFLSKNRQFFYFSNNRFYKLDLSTPGNSAVVIYGNGTVAMDNTVGAKGTDSPVRLAGTGGTGNTACNECTIFSNSDGTRVWAGGAYNQSNATGTNTWSELEYSAGEQLYRIKSSTFPAQRQMVNAYSTDFDDKIYARGRDSSASIHIFDPATSTASSANVEGFNGLNAGYYFNLFSSVSNLYMIGTYQEIQVLETDLSAAATIAGNNANKIGDGKDPSSVDFNLITGLSLDPTSGLLAISQSSNFRFYNFNDTGSGFFSSIYGIRNAYGYAAEVSIAKGGARMNHHPSSGSAGTFHTTTIDIPGRSEVSTTFPTSSGDNAYSTTYDYDVNGGINDGTSTNNLYKFFRNPVSGAILTSTGAEYYTILAHSNGNSYIQAQSKTNNHSYIYNLKTDNKIYKVAGKAGAAGYSVADNGALALGAQLSASVAFMHEIKSGTYAGDLLIVDGDMIRRISIATESLSPKIYDIAKFTLADDFSVSTVFSDIVYDDNTEISGVPGTGTFYYVRTAPTLEVHKWKAVDSTFTDATDTTYELKGLTLSGTYRLTHGTVGVLLLEKSQNRILLLPH